MRRAVQKLRPRAKRIIRMRFWEGFTVQEIADIELVSGTMIRSIIERSEKRILLTLRLLDFNLISFWAEHKTETQFIKSNPPASAGYEMSVPPYIAEPTLTVGAGNLRFIRNTSGCYAWIDTVSGQVMRVGLSVSLRDRVCSYLASGYKASNEFTEWYWSSDPDQHVAVVVWECEDFRNLEKALLSEFTPPLNANGGTLARRVS